MELQVTSNFIGDSDEKLFDMELINIEDEVAELQKTIIDADFSSVGMDKTDFLVMFGLGAASAALSVLGSDNLKALQPSQNELATTIQNLIDNTTDHSIHQLKGGWRDILEDLAHDTSCSKLKVASKGIMGVTLIIWLLSKSITVFGYTLPGMEPTIHALGEKLKNGEVSFINSPAFASLVVDSFSVGLTEVCIRLYLYFKYKDCTEHTEKALNAKRDKMLLVAHGINSVISSGAAYLTSNPSTINYVAIVRVIMLAWKAIKQQGEVSKNLQKAVHVSSLIAMLQVRKTMVIYSHYLVYTNCIYSQLDELNRELELQRIQHLIDQQEIQNLINMQNGNSQAY